MVGELQNESKLQENQMKSPHAHVQIEYTRACDQVESLVGFNPTDLEDRKFVHTLLDEYLDYLSKRVGDGEEGERNEANHFRVSDWLDKH